MSSSKKPHIIGTSLDDTHVMSYLLLAGKSAHAPGNLSRGSCSEWSAKVNTPISSHFEEENGGPRCKLLHSPPGTWMHPMLSQPGYSLFKTCV